MAKPHTFSVRDMNGFQVAVSDDFSANKHNGELCFRGFFIATYVMPALDTTHFAPLLGILKNVLDSVKDHLLGQKKLPYKLMRRHKTQKH